MSKLNKKFYNILNRMNDRSLSAKDIPHEDLVTLLECGFLNRENYNIVSGKGILALDEYRTDKLEKIKSCIILFTSIASFIISIFTLLKQ